MPDVIVAPSAFCLICQSIERATCSRYGGPACGRCDRCYGCERVICYRCDTQPATRFEFPGDTDAHPHNERPCVLPTTVMLS